MFTKGLGLFPTEPALNVVEYATLAESLGYANIWFGDSQNLWREATTVLGAASVVTDRIILGSGVTNATTRHRSVIASSWVTLGELSNGRVALGIGTGDSSLRTMGLQPLKLAQFEQAIQELRALFSGNSVIEPESGAKYQLDYVKAPFHVPIYVAASAPRILELAGRVADGVILLVGTAASMIEAALHIIEVGAISGGRTLADVHIVLWTPTAISKDRAAARDLVRSHVARVAMRPLPVPLDAQQENHAQRIRETYDYYHHMDTEAGHANFVTDELVDAFSLSGTFDDCAARAQELKTLGLDQVSIVPFVARGESRSTTIRLFAELVDSL